jgi:hypothetical protein
MTAVNFYTGCTDDTAVNAITLRITNALLTFDAGYLQDGGNLERWWRDSVHPR